MKRQNTSPKTSFFSWRRAGVLALCLVFLYVLVPQIKGLSASLHSLTHAHVSYVFGGIGITSITFLVAAVMYQLLSKHRLHYARTLLVQAASGFSNRLLPAGLGGMGLIAQYLRTQQHTTAEAVSVVGMDDFIGIIGHFGLFGVVIVFANVSFIGLHPTYDVQSLAIALFVLALCIGGLLTIGELRPRIIRGTRHVIDEFLDYRQHPWRLVLALGDSLLLTFLYVSVLWCSARALGIDLSFARILVIFTAGSAVGTATPTPGGLIGTEAGLFAGFLGYGVSGSPALAAALLYRLLTYWLPIIPGVLAFIVVQRRLRLFR
ncbi:MAG TPA: lysylphosphatidylglycerol synthase transmembrane domain-containing protein [Candidatus Saccharimonadales bacterium]|nr:lysylphosphatidylglycerol synthase transmembrane domain-containing protein [Candidatus Saccharimonadales bacterium]